MGVFPIFPPHSYHNNLDDRTYQSQPSMPLSAEEQKMYDDDLKKEKLLDQFLDKDPYLKHLSELLNKSFQGVAELQVKGIEPDKNIIAYIKGLSDTYRDKEANLTKIYHRMIANTNPDLKLLQDYRKDNDNKGVR